MLQDDWKFSDNACIMVSKKNVTIQWPTKGHALILPKHHYANLYEIPEEMAAKAMVLAKRMAAAMTEALGCDGFNIVQNNGEVAGQTVFHFHMHLIPRYNGDQAGITWKPGELKDEVRDEIVAKVTAALM